MDFGEEVSYLENRESGYDTVIVSLATYWYDG